MINHNENKKIKMINRSHEYDINRRRRRHVHKNTKY